TQVGPYIPQQLLAMGAQASVWLATGPDGAEVALKVARGEDGKRGIAREARILAVHGHPNLVRSLGSDPGGDWIALERIEGLTVDQWARDQSPEAVVAVAQKLVDAIEYLHAQSIVHGDIKPSNVIVDLSGEPHLLDLGVAVEPGEQVDGFRGTLGYAAPELLNGRPPSSATDLYGLGALLYTALTGRTPFVAPDPAALTYLPLVSLPASPAAFRPELPASLTQLLLALLARDPDRRPSDLGRVRDALDRASQTLPAPPVLGMLEEREELRRAVVGAADGEPRVVVLYGSPGSGRRTLIAETVEYARREGLPYLKGTDPQAALEQLRVANRPAVLVMKAAYKGARQLAEIALKDGLRCLLLLHADRPLSGLHGAIQLTPSPLSVQDAARLARLWGADPDQAESWWRQSMGLPIAIVGRIRAFRRQRGLTQTHHSQLPSESRRILEFLRGQPRMRCDVVHLATELQMSEHVLLDHCEVLFAEDLVEPADDGAMLAIVQARSVM
ncbi:MAG: serine/threonine-protein kinase PknK, partial [Myxococcales bacterium]|nr:serine/threonine-protein kinase PknK [Myxococcales bacterium]